MLMARSCLPFNCQFHIFIGMPKPKAWVIATQDSFQKFLNQFITVYQNKAVQETLVGDLGEHHNLDAVCSSSWCSSSYQGPQSTDPVAQPLGCHAFEFHVAKVAHFL